MACRVVVTGVSGFVGGALGLFLRRAGGYHVVGISRTPAREGSVDEFIAHDLTKTLARDVEPADAIVHCAALSSPWAPPRRFHAQNVVATGNVLDYARRTGCRRFVFISSSSVYYRHGDQRDITETTPFPDVAINEYARTKREAEALVLASGLAAIVLRPRAVFGPGDTVLFPRILRAARRGALPRMRRADGVSPQGDLIYIDNLSWYIERAIRSTDCGCFNLTNAEPVELNVFLSTILERLGLPPIRRTIPVKVAFRVAGVLETLSRVFLGYREPPITRFGVEVMAYSKTFDVSKAIAAFGAPPVPILEGLERFVAWQREQWAQGA